jgi:hypothetical protein
MAVLPDTPGSRLGLRPSDVLTQPLGQKRWSLEQTMQPGERSLGRLWRVREARPLAAPSIPT